MAFDIPPLPPGTCVTVLGARLTPVNTSPLWAGVCLFTSYLDSRRTNWSDGSLSGSRFFWSEVLLSTCTTDQPLNDYLGFGPEAGHVGPLPEVIHQINIFDGWPYRYPPGLADIYFTQSTFHGPGTPPELRPALLIITGQ